MVEESASLSKIPRNFYQTHQGWGKVGDKCREFMDKLIKLNPEWTHHFFDDTQCAQMIEEHFDKRTLGAFKKLKAGAAKADLWRYCVIYIHGGLYLDMDADVSMNFNELLRLSNNPDFLLFYDGHPTLVQYVFAAQPKSKFLKRAVEIATDRILSGEENIFTATGPRVFNDAFIEVYGGLKVYNCEVEVDGSVRKDIYDRNGAVPENGAVFSYFDEYKESDLYEEGEKYVTESLGPTPGLYHGDMVTEIW